MAGIKLFLLFFCGGTQKRRIAPAAKKHALLCLFHIAILKNHATLYSNLHYSSKFLNRRKKEPEAPA